jgi:two-component system CheB/CheR fusion protein
MPIGSSSSSSTKRARPSRPGSAARAPRAVRGCGRGTDHDEKARLQAIVRGAVDAIITIDQRGVIDSVNPATERLFGYGAAELVGRNVSVLMPPPHAAEHDRYIRDYLRTDRRKVIGIGREVLAARKDGSLVPISLAVSEVRIGGGRHLFIGIIHDLSSRRRLERQIVEVAAAEQRRIGQELHDGLCQDLFCIAMGLEMLSGKLEREAHPQAASALKITESVRHATERARRLAHGLNPVDLDAGGLPAALEQLAEQTTRVTGVRCAFHWDGAARPAGGDGNVATHLYRIAQEAVNNAVSHASATKIDIRLACEDGHLALSIADDGKGLAAPVADHTSSADLTTAPHPKSDPYHGGMGVRTMHYRARMMGGTFAIDGRAGGGTKVTCRLGA